VTYKRKIFTIQNIEVKVCKNPTYYTNSEIKLDMNGNLLVNKD